MSHATGKIEVLAIDERHIYLRYHSASDPASTGRFSVYRRDDAAYWLDHPRAAEGFEPLAAPERSSSMDSFPRFVLSDEERSFLSRCCAEVGSSENRESLAASCRERAAWLRSGLPRLFRPDRGGDARPRLGRAPPHRGPAERRWRMYRSSLPSGCCSRCSCQTRESVLPALQLLLHRRSVRLRTLGCTGGFRGRRLQLLPAQALRVSSRPAFCARSMYSATLALPTPLVQLDCRWLKPRTSSKRINLSHTESPCRASAFLRRPECHGAGALLTAHSDSKPATLPTTLVNWPPLPSESLAGRSESIPGGILFVQSNQSP